MASWMEERDRLVAQTAAFVQQVAAAHPEVSARPEIEKLLADKAEAIKPVPAEPARPSLKAAEPAVPTADAVLAALPIATAPTRSAKRLPPVSERSDIMQRVAAFRARQARMNAERETYYENMREKIRSQLGNEPRTDRL